MRKLLLLLFIVLLFYPMVSFAQNISYQLSTHVLDISEGAPGENVRVVLEKQNDKKGWDRVGEAKTDSNGRISNFLPLSDGKTADTLDNKGVYRLIFYTGDYFENKSVDTFYPFVEVVFMIKDANHYHVPITLSPFGYSTYRGS